jgi:glucokinase
MTLTIGIDIGGTKISGGVVDERGQVLREVVTESPARDVDAINIAVTRVVRDLRADHPVTAVGIGAAGWIDHTRSEVLFAPNLAWRHVPLRSQLSEALGLPVVVENDGNTATWAEFVFGAAATGGQDIVMATVGTGIGGGIITGGQLYRGGFGIAAEIGHQCFVPDGLPCGCGLRGCWEQYASGSAVVRLAREGVAAGDPAAEPLLNRAGGDPAGINGPLITMAAQDGDPFAVAQLAAVGTHLGEGLASLAATLDPAIIVIGGGVSAAGDLLVAAIDR